MLLSKFAVAVALAAALFAGHVPAGAEQLESRPIPVRTHPPSTAARVALLAAPNGLSATNDDAVCASHMAMFGCHLAKGDGDLILVWSWSSYTATCAPSCIRAVDGFRVYPALGPGAESRAARMAAVGGSSAPRPIASSSPDQTATVLTRAQLPPGRCVAVRAFRGTVESLDSRVYCVRASDYAGVKTITIPLKVAYDQIQRVDDPNSADRCLPASLPQYYPERQPDGQVTYNHTNQVSFPYSVGHASNGACKAGFGVAFDGASAIQQLSVNGKDPLFDKGARPIVITGARLVIAAGKKYGPMTGSDCRVTLYAVTVPSPASQPFYFPGRALTTLTDFENGKRFTVDVTETMKSWLYQNDQWWPHLALPFALRRDTRMSFANIKTSNNGSFSSNCISDVGSATLIVSAY